GSGPMIIHPAAVPGGDGGSEAVFERAEAKAILHSTISCGSRRFEETSSHKHPTQEPRIEGEEAVAASRTGKQPLFDVRTAAWSRAGDDLARAIGQRPIRNRDSARECRVIRQKRGDRKSTRLNSSH